MANLKPKTPIFKSISGETALGGAPIYADDIVRLQENNRGDILNYFEAARRLLPELLTWDGAALNKQFENGLILSGLEYDNSDPAAPVVSEGYILSGGEVCYYPGGTLATGLVNSGLLYLYKGAAVYTPRTFSTGGSKDILVTHNVVIEQGEVDVNGPNLNGSTAITATDEVVVLQVGIASGIGESNFSMRAALGIGPIGAQINQNPWVAATLEGTNIVDTKLGYIVSRVNQDGTTEIRGTVKILAAALSGATLDVITLNASNLDFSTNLNIHVQNSELLPEINRAIITPTGKVSIFEPATGWGVANITLVFNVVFLGTTTLPTPYTYNANYLDIT
jgi:hypothetical protein